MSNIVRVLLVIVSVSELHACYWNRQCPYLLHATKTPYETVRGDIRDYSAPSNCEAVSVWSLNRHGNRNPGSRVTAEMKEISLLKDEIIASHQAGNGQLCAQEIEDFRNWSWNSTVESSISFLTGTGYEELYNIGRRIGQKYPHLVQGSSADFLFRPTNEQRTIASGAGFIHGLTEGTNANLSLDDAWERDDIIRPYENCDRYQLDAKGGETLTNQLEAYFKRPDFLAVQAAVQQRLGIPTQLTSSQVYAIFEMCRFYRSWSPTLQSPWCSVFTNEDLVVLEYYDDIRHYYRNGYGSWVNVNLGHTALKDLYEKFEAAVNGNGKKIVSYFSHDAMIEMALCAMGMFKDPAPLDAGYRNPDRLWRTSQLAAFSSNIVGVLNRCTVSNITTYRVQLFFNEKETPVCPLEGCTWEQFREKFQHFTDSNLDFCSMDYVHVEDTPQANSAGGLRPFWSW